MPTSSTLTIGQATFELELLSAEAESLSPSDLYAWLRELGLPSEVAIRLTDFVDYMKSIGGKVVRIGRIVIQKLMEFVRAHPNLASGVAVAVALTALVNSIPFLGPVLSPIIAMLSIPVAAIVGNRLDKQSSNSTNEQPEIQGLITELIEVARIFFEFLALIFKTITSTP